MFPLPTDRLLEESAILPDPADHSSVDPASAGELARAIAATIRQPILLLDETASVVFANTAFYRVFGLRGEETVGTVLWDLGDGQWNVQILRDALRGVGGSRADVEDVEVRHDSGRLGPRLFLVSARQVEPYDSHRLTLLEVEDITEQRRLELALQRHMRQLERSNQDLEEFAHAASHDLQEPLRKMRTFANRLMDSMKETELTPRQHQYLERIEQAGQRMQLRIDDLLGLARVARRRPQHETVDLGELLERVLGDLESAIEGSGATFEIGALPLVEADAPSMELLFQNLVSNAIKYRKDEVAPAIRVAARTIPPPDLPGPEWTRITVSDNGIGFEEIYAERIFRPFERLHGRDEYEGSGVGLSICRRVVELHGGTITATAQPGAGATFEIEMPTLQREEEV